MQCAKPKNVAQVCSAELPIPYVAQVCSPVLPIPYVAQVRSPVLPIPYVAHSPVLPIPVKVLGASIFFWTLKILFVLHCLQFGFLVWGFDGGCELMLARFAFYKSPEQELNLSRS